MSKSLLFAIALGLASACSNRNENSAHGDMESASDSVQTVAPNADGVPSSSTPSNAGSPPDSAAASVDSVSVQ